MRSTAAAEASAVDKPAKPAARKRAGTPKTTPRSRTTRVKPAPLGIVEPTPAPPPAVAVKAPRHNFRAIAAFGIVLAAAIVALLLVDRNDAAPPQQLDEPVVVSASELASVASSHSAPVYWAGELPSRTMELTTTATGTFVRYLPAGSAVGSSSRALTIATYPLVDAYGTAAGRAKEAGMTSLPTRNGGLAVWSKAQPTSVYVAFRGVRSLIEVYAPQAREARTLALSGRIRAVR